MSELLRRLLGKEVKFIWDEQCDLSLEEIKQRMCKKDYLGYFHREDRIQIITDASPVGLGAFSYRLTLTSNQE